MFTGREFKSQHRILYQARADEHIMTILISFYLVLVHEILVHER